MQHGKPTPKKAGVIMIGYKNYVNRFLDECRDSLRLQTYPNFRVYIVDNCSINDCEYIKKYYPEAKCTARPDGNYAAANNLGIEMARRDGCEYFVIANMDTIFAPDWLTELVKAVESDPKIGIAQSKILLYPKTNEEKTRPTLNSLGNFMHYLGFGFTDGYREPDREISGYPEINGYASGCSFIVKKTVLDTIGGYDENYWMYHDDIEMSWRVRLAGYRIVLSPRSVMYHKYEFSRSILMLYYMERNRHLAMLHFYRLPTLLLILPASIFMDLGMCFYALIGGWFLTELRVIGYFLKPDTWRKIFSKRRQVAKIRKRTDHEIIKGFLGKVEFQEVENPVLRYFANPIFDFYWQIIKHIIIW